MARRRGKEVEEGRREVCRVSERGKCRCERREGGKDGKDGGAVSLGAYL